MNPVHFLLYVIHPTLRYLGRFEPRMSSDAACALLLGTGQHETELQYLQQLGDGPALGPYQVEPATHADIWAWLLRRPDLHAWVLALTINNFDLDPDRNGSLTDELRFNLVYSTAIARLVYWRRPEALPGLDAEDLARYHEIFYNSRLGAIGRTPDVLEALHTFEDAIAIVEAHPIG